MITGADVKNYLDQAEKAEVSTISDIEKYLNHHKTCAHEKYAFFIPSYCGHCGASFGWDLTCNKEFCETCGQTHSDAHLRRFARWYGDKYDDEGNVVRAGKARQMAKMSYFVITFPEEEREALKNPVKLRTVRKQIIGWLKTKGYERGLSRWHWFGEQSQPARWYKTMDNKPLYKSAHVIPDEDMKYHPHLNILTDGTWIELSELKKMELQLEKVIGIEGVNINHSYAENDPKKKKFGTATMAHWVMYVSRPTFKKISWEPELVEKLWNFRNTHCWGNSSKWQGSAKWGLEDIQGETETREYLDKLAGVNLEYVSKLRQGKCPCCDHKLEFIKPLSRKLISPAAILEYYGAGAYRMIDNVPKRRFMLPQKIVDYINTM
jgi:hypothetical protein